MVNVDFTQNYRDNLNALFVESIYIDNNNSDLIREKLYTFSLVKGLRVNDISELTGWPKSKTSKIISNNQLLSMDDIRNWSRSLGFTPEPFIGIEKSFVEYSLDEHIRTVSSALYDYFTSDDYYRRNAILKFEFPLGVSNLFGFEMTDYVIRFHGLRPDNSRTKPLFETKKSIRIHNRSFDNKGDNNSLIPEFGVFFHKKKKMVLSVYLRTSTNELYPDVNRKKFKEILNNDLLDGSYFVHTKKDLEKLLPDEELKGEVLSAIVSREELQKEGYVERKLLEIYKYYCDLFYELYGVPILPNKAKYYLDNGLETQVSGAVIDTFDPYTINSVKIENKYSCEIDPEHGSFMTADEEPYIDVVPLIPFSRAEELGADLRIEANAVCLCPVCKARLSFGTVEDREEMYYRLYKRHKKSLVDAGVDVKLQDVLGYNGV